MIRTSLSPLRQLLAGVLFLCAFAMTASAATINVGPTRAITTIQGGVNAASAGDTVQVDAGTYTESVNVNRSPLTINGAGPTTIVTGPTAGAGNAQAGAFVVTTSDGAVIISNLTIQNSMAQGAKGSGGLVGGVGGGGGGAGLGGGLFVGTGSNVTISNVVVQNNAANGGAGGAGSGGLCNGGNSSLGAGAGTCDNAGSFGGGGGGGSPGGGLNGGFGGGGGGAGFAGGNGGIGGFGGGVGGLSATGQTAGGGGGAGFGGAVFVQQGGSLTITGGTTVTGNTALDGSGGTGATGGLGGISGTINYGGIFLQGNDAADGGSGTIIFNPAVGVTQNDADGIADQTGLGGTGLNAGSWSLVKNGAGLLVMNASNNNYTGTTSINAGLTEVVGILGLTTGGDVTVANGAALGGGGTVNPNVVLSPGGILQPGIGAGIPETLTIGRNVTWNGSTGSPMMLFVLYSGGASDKVASAGALAKGTAGTFQFNFQGTGAAGTYTLMTYTSTTFVISDFSYINLGPGLAGQFTAGASALLFTVSQVATSTGVSASSSTVNAGASETLTATVTSSAGTPTGSVTFTDSAATPTTLGTVTLVNGQASFTSTTLPVGANNITAVYNPPTGAWLGSSGNTSVTVNSPTTHFSVTASSPQTAGVAFNVTVTALDSSNATVTGYSGTVHFTGSDGSATLPANSTLTNGTGTFSVTLKTGGSQTVTATDTVTGSITGTATITVNPGPATHFTVSAVSPETSGTAFNVTVQALDVGNNNTTNYSGTVHFTSTDGSATLPANSTLTGGAGTFSATLLTAGSQTIAATDTVSGSIAGTSNTIVVHVGTATHLAVTATSPETAGVAFSVTVTALDAGNNIATGYTGIVHFTKSDAGAGSAVPGNYTFTGGDSGVHTFSATLVTAGSQSVTATDTVTLVTGTATITVNAGGTAHFTVSAPPSQTAGTAFNFTVTAIDAFGNTTTSYGGTVHFSSTDGVATLPANSTFTGGVGTFSATLKTVGSQTITAIDAVTITINGTSNTITVNSGVATHFVVSATSPQTSGIAFNFTVQAVDVGNNNTTNYSGTLHFTSTDGSATLPANSTLTNGAGTFSATLSTAGNQTITATDTVSGSITGTSNTIAVHAGAATHLTVAATSPETAGAAFNVTVTALDGGNNVATGYTGIVHFTKSDAGAGSAVPANYSFNGGDAGVHTFSVTLVTAGSQTVTATDTVTASITGTATITVNAAAAAHLTVSAPASQTAGTAFNFTVTAIDAFGNTTTGYAGTVHFTSSDGLATLPANSTVASGAGTFSATLKTVGSQTITATDTVTGSITGTSNTITVNPGGATHFSVSATSPQTAGTAFSFTVTAQDASNNTATGYSGTVHFTSSDGSATLPANSSLASGVGTFSATLLTGGNQTIAATDTVSGSITGTSNTIAVHAGAATHLTVAATSPETAGAAFNVTVTALDGGNNVATGYTGIVHFTKSDTGAGSAVPANYGFTGGDAGVHTFSVTLVTAGSQTVAATDTVTASITGTATITVNAGAAAHFTVSATSPQTAGAAFNFTVTALDAFNNASTGYAGTVHFTSSDGAAILPANSTLASGAGTFSATLKTVGSQSITATDTVTGSITGTSNTITVNPGAATHFVVSATSPQAAGTAFNFTVTAQDASNNTATGYAGTAHFTSSDGSATLPANSTLASGVATFSATLKTSGSQTLTATDTVTVSITGTSSGITVNAGPATHLVVSASSPQVAGVAFNVQVTAQDQFNNISTNYLGTVHFTSSDGQAVLPANGTLPGGFATFSATLKTAGGQTITATDTVTSSITGNSSMIAVSAAAASHFVVSAPSTATLGTAFNFIVTAQDPFNNVASSYAGMVHFTSTDPAAVLPANSSLTAGVGSFSATLKTFGARTITATDTVSGSITGISGTINVNGILTVTPSGTTRAYGTANSLSYTITGFQNGDTTAVVSGTPALSSQASLSSPPGTYTVTATQGTLSTANYVFTFVPGSMTVVKASTALGVSGITPGITASLGQSFIVSFTVASAPGAAAPTGTVSYSVDGGALQTAVLNNGTATVTFAGLTMGPHTVLNSYSGDGNYLPTSATPLTLTVMKTGSQLAVAVSPSNTVQQGQSFTLSFMVTGTGAITGPTGSVSCTVDGGTTPQTATLTSGSGSLTLANLAVGNHNVVCTYSGDTNYPAAVAPAITLTVQTAAPVLGAVVSAAGFGPAIAPGGLCTIFGANLAAATAFGSLPLPTVLNNVQVLVNGRAAPLLYVSATQINFQAPYETTVGTPLQVVVLDGTLSSLPLMATFQQYAPDIFTYQRTATSTDPVIDNASFSLITPSAPAQAGGIVIIYLTGVGVLNNTPADGTAAPSSPLAQTVVTPTVTVGGIPATVLFSGLAPGFVGELQINVQLPATLPNGNGTPPSLPVVVMFPGASSAPVNLWMNQ
jgi:hypothetical protein